MAALGEVPFGLYYGSVDATPLFVMLADLYFKRTGDTATLVELWPAVEAALSWMDHAGDRDGDGFIEYYCTTERGLANQSWKDSHDAIFHADGRLAEGPIALAEVQGSHALSGRMLPTGLGKRHTVHVDRSVPRPAIRPRRERNPSEQPQLAGLRGRDGTARFAAQRCRHRR